MNKVFSVVFIWAVVFFSLWLRQPVKADCESDCYSPNYQQQMEAECNEQCLDGEPCNVSGCITNFLNTCLKSCPPATPKKSPPKPLPTPGTPIVQTPLSAEPKVSCDGATCPSVVNKSAFLPDCVYHEGNNSPAPGAKNGTVEQCCGCRNVNVFVSLLVKLANWLFTIVGAAALVMFIYGGFTMLTAAGSAERVKKGQGVLAAAVIGLIIIFTAQMGMRFLLKTVLLAEDSKVILESNLEIKLPDK